jgi:hypothetical protein
VCEHIQLTGRQGWPERGFCFSCETFPSPSESYLFLSHENLGEESSSLLSPLPSLAPHCLSFIFICLRAISTSLCHHPHTSPLVPMASPLPPVPHLHCTCRSHISIGVRALHTDPPASLSSKRKIYGFPFRSSQHNRAPLLVRSRLLNPTQQAFPWDLCA